MLDEFEAAMRDEFDYGCVDGSVGCALPNVRYVLALGAVVVVAALGLWAARKFRPW